MLATNTSVFMKSLEVADKILRESDNLVNAGVDSNLYVDRVDYLRDLLGEDGHVQFHPIVEKDLTKDFRREIRPLIDHFNHIYNTAPIDSERERNARQTVKIASRLRDNITNEHLLNNEIPSEVRNFLEFNRIKDFPSPKLSKMLVKLFDQDSGIVKWFTNKCPKNLDKGLNEDYNVHLSILPHHIVGMAYYAPYNWGGERWETGWNCTSCMDTIRNSKGAEIFKLPPNLKDTTLAIAYLTTTVDDDLYEPRYLARSLVRVAKVNDNDYVMVGFRPFYTNNEMRDILFEGLSNEFENFVSAMFLRDNYGRSWSQSDNRIFQTDMDLKWELSQDVDCYECGGDGQDGWGDMCERCDGDGTLERENDVFLPYNDDHDLLIIDEDYVSIQLPVQFLQDRGYMERVDDEQPTTEETPQPHRRTVDISDILWA